MSISLPKEKKNKITYYFLLLLLLWLYGLCWNVCRMIHFHRPMCAFNLFISVLHQIAFHGLENVFSVSRWEINECYLLSYFTEAESGNIFVSIGVFELIVCCIKGGFSVLLNWDFKCLFWHKYYCNCSFIIKISYKIVPSRVAAIYFFSNGWCSISYEKKADLGHRKRITTLLCWLYSYKNLR